MDVLLESSIRITVVAVAVAAGLRLFRVASPRSAHRAWTGVCVVMFVLPAIVAWAPDAMVPILPARAGGMVTGSLPHSHGDVHPVDSMAAATLSQPAAISWIAIGAVAYAGGVLLLLFGLVLGWWQGRTMIRQAKAVRGRLTHPRCITPVTVGLWSPVVILPPDWVEWDERDLAAVLAHEEEHARWRDPLVACVTLITRAVFWFHPLAWWLRREIATLSEQACDAVVLSRGHDAGRYASVLLRFARAAAAAGGRVAPVSMAMAGAGLPARLDLLHAPPAPAVSPRQAVCTTLAYVAIVAIYAPKPSLSSADGPYVEGTGTSVSRK